MYLSPVYKRVFWALVYHTQPGSAEVELVTNKLFDSKKKALKWFARKRQATNFIQPEAIMVTGVDKLTVCPDNVMGHKEVVLSISSRLDPNLDGRDDPLDTY